MKIGKKNKIIDNSEIPKSNSNNSKYYVQTEHRLSEWHFHLSWTSHMEIAKLQLTCLSSFKIIVGISIMKSEHMCIVTRLQKLPFKWRSSYFGDLNSWHINNNNNNNNMKKRYYKKL